jgi:hypothetical protein
MLAAVAPDARMLKTAKMIVEVRIDLLSAKTRLFIKRSVAVFVVFVVELLFAV